MFLFSDVSCIMSLMQIQVFFMLDTKSLMLAMACCTMFHKCALDPFC